ncbi:MAG: sulfite exporter TauE/SafE family protein [Porticoccaceae bacterium]
MEFLLIYMAIGVFAGLSAGLLGVGGGAVTVPLLLWVFALEGFSNEVATHIALATSLAAMTVTSISSTLAHAGKKAVMWNVFAFLAIGVVLGSIAGVLSAVNIAGHVLQIAFAFFLAYVALQMIFGFSPSPDRSVPAAPGLVGAGGVIGCVSMYFGIGGGSLTVPYLSYCGVPPRQAVGTSAALGLPIALWGTVLYVISGWDVAGLPDGAYGYVYFPAALGIVLTSAVFARVGANIAHRLKPAQLRKVFGLVLLTVSADLIWRNLG